MVDLAYGALAIWFGGLIYFVARALNYFRLTYNNLAPTYWGRGSSLSDLRRMFSWYISRRFTVDPAYLTGVGQQHQKHAIRNIWMMCAWIAIGLVMIVGFFSYIEASVAVG